jgi:hypothetical protein
MFRFVSHISSFQSAFLRNRPFFSMAHDSTARGAHAYFSHSPVTLEALLVVRRLESRHLRIGTVIRTVAVPACHEIVYHRVSERSGVKRVAFLAGQRTEITVLMMARPAIRRNGNVFRMVEYHRPVFIGQAVQGCDCRSFRGISSMDRSCKSHADTCDKEYQQCIFHL